MHCVYRYGVATPTVHHDRIMDQIRAARAYRNDLIAIERGRRAAERSAVAEWAPDLASLTQAVHASTHAVEAALRAIRKERSKTKKRSESTAMKVTLKEARAARKQAVAAVRELRAQLRGNTEWQARRDAISELSLSLVRDARAISGLAKRGPHFGAWGTYQLVEDAAQASFASLPLYQDDGITPNDPDFLPLFVPLEGAVSVQIQGGATLEEVTTDSLESGHAQLRMILPDERAWLPMPGNGPVARWRFARQAALGLCLGTDADGERLFGHFRLDMHRPLPKGARIKRATVSRKISGPFTRWALELTLDTPDPPTVAAATPHAVALDIGWRQIEGQLRVVGWMDSGGASGDVCLSAALIRALREPDEIQSKRTHLFDMQLLRLRPWIAAFPVPQGMKRVTETMAQWKSFWRLHALVRDWAENRFEGDVAMFESTVAWATADRHYWMEETRRRDAALRRRKDFYRNEALRFVRTYRAIVLEEFDLRRIAKRPTVDGKTENETARSNRHLAALSEFRLCLLSAARVAGRLVVSRPSENSTRQCPECGLIKDREAAKAIRLACECGAEWDQDVDGAPRILLTGYTEDPKGNKTLVAPRDKTQESEGEPVKEDRRARVRRLRVEKQARMRSAVLLEQRP